MRPLREIKIRTIVFHAKNAESAKFYFPFVFHACAGVVANFVTTRVRRAFIHPLPPAGYSPCLRGRKWVIAFAINFPPLRQGRCRRATEGWIVFRFHFSPFSSVGDYVAHDDVLIPLAVVLSGLESQTGKDNISSRPPAQSTVAQQGAYKGIAILVAPFLQGDHTLVQLASLGLLARHLLGLTLFDNFED